MKKLLLLTLLTFNAYAVDPLIEPITPLNCNWPTEREDGVVFPDAERGGINMYRSDTSGDYNADKLVATSDIMCMFEINNTVLPDGVHYFVVTAFDKSGRESGYSVEYTHLIDRPVLPPKPPMPPTGLGVVPTGQGPAQ